MGLLCRGSFSKLVEIPWRYSWLIPVAFLLQIGIFSSWFRALDWGDRFAPSLYIFSDVLLLAAVAFNFSLGGMKVLGLGLLMNLCVIATNGGYMPASIDVAENLGYTEAAEALRTEGHVSNWRTLDDDTRLPFLADVLTVPFVMPGGRPIFSVGDVFIGYGVFGLVWGGMMGWRE